MRREEEIERGRRAIRASWRMETRPEELEVVSRILAGLPARSDTSPVLRVGAAGRELLSLRELVLRTRQMVIDGELPLESDRERNLLDDVLVGSAKLVAAIEAHLGSYSALDAPPGRRSGVRETFLVELDPEHHASARWLIDLAHQANDAPAPPEPVGQMTLRAIAEDLREVERFLIDAGEEMEGELRDLVVEVHTGCGELAGALEEVLPPAPDGLATGLRRDLGASAGEER